MSRFGFIVLRTVDRTLIESVDLCRPQFPSFLRPSSVLPAATTACCGAAGETLVSEAGFPALALYHGSFL